MKLWLDDLRAAPDGWVWCATVADAQRLLRRGGVTHASLDHDLGDSPERDPESPRPDAPTGYDLVNWMAETGHWPENKPLVHSANPAGRARMVLAIEAEWPRRKAGAR